MFLTKLLTNRIALLLITVIVVGIFLMSKNQNNTDLFITDNYKAFPNQPLDFPATIVPDFPVYPDAIVLRMTTKPPSQFSAAFASKDSPQKVFTFLLENAKKNSWQIIEQRGLVFRSTKDKAVVTISISQSPGEKTAILEQVTLNQ